MTQVITNHPRGGWQKDEIDLLFSTVREATQEGRALREVFADVGGRLSRKPNSIRNFYYARVREVPELAPKQQPFRAFTKDELHELLRNVLIGRQQGESVRACVTRLAGGDRAGMLRYQNKYRSILKNRPELLLSVADELRAQGLPCPDAVITCRHYGRAPAPQIHNPLAQLAQCMNDPCVSQMLEGLCELLKRADENARMAEERASEANAIAPLVDEEPLYDRRFEDARREADRLRVEVDLLKMALEDARAMQ
ncbi:MAG: hypothetical protein RR821_06950 [Clostridia bacterium]